MTADQHDIADDIRGIGRRCYAFQARKTANAVLRAYNDWMRPIGLEMAQFSTLCAILQTQAQSIGELADELGVERTTLVRNLKLLQAKGLVEVAGRNRRRLTHTLTAEGLATVARGLPLWEQAQEAMERALGPPRERDIREALRDLRRALPVAFTPDLPVPQDDG